MNKILIIAFLCHLFLLSSQKIASKTDQDAIAKSTLGEPPISPYIPPTPVPGTDDTLPSNYYYYDELVTKLNIYRETYANMYKDIDIDLEMRKSSLNELKRLLNDIDSFGEHTDFETTYKSQQQPPQFCEFICKLHQQYTSNADRCIELWDKKEQLREHMRLEYSKGGSTCANYGNGVLCVMHVKETATTTQ